MYTPKKIIFALFALSLVIAGCAGGRSTFSKAQKLESEGKLDEAVMKYAEAVSENRDEQEYRLRFLDASDKAAAIHMAKGEAFLEKEDLDEALREYQTALAMNPSLNRAKEMSDKVVKLRNSLVYQKEGEELEKARKPREAIQSYQKALEFNPANETASKAIERIQKVRKTKLEGAELNLKSSKPITLKFKDAKIKDIFGIITQLSGINFVFDEGIKDANMSIFLENATFQQALDVITGIQKLGKKVLNENTIILYTKSPEKQKQYEDLMVQTFYLNKLEAKKAVNLIRTMLQVKKIYVNEDMNALVVRDVPDVIEVIGRILEANDVPDAEVLLEVEVIEVSKKNAESLGLALSRYAISMNATTPAGGFLSDTLNPVFSTIQEGQNNDTPSTPGTSPAQLVNNLAKVFTWDDYKGYITVPSATFSFGKTLSNAETLASPKIRVKNREKAKFNVGTRVPITTTSSPTGGGVSVNVQYVDVGVKVNAEPTIQLNNEVSIKLSLEVSSILSKEKIGDATSLTTVVTIGTRNLDTVLSLKDGETSVIGGLVLDNKTKSKQKVIVLGDLPLIGPLLSGHDNSNDKGELILAITPRIVRGIAVPEGDAAQFWSGREDEPSIKRPYSSFAQEDEFEDEVKAADKGQATPPQRFSKSPSTQPAPPAAAPAQPRPAAAVAPPATPMNQPAPTSTPILQQTPPSTPIPQPAPTGTPIPPAADPAVVPQPESQPAEQPSVPAGQQAPAPAVPSTPAKTLVPAGQPAPAAPIALPTDASDQGIAQPVIPLPLPQVAAPPSQAQPPSIQAAPPASPPPAAVAQPQQQSPRVSVTISAPPQVKVQDQFKVEIKASEVAGLVSAPFVLVYDPIFVDFASAMEGDLLKRDGKNTVFRATNDRNTGQVTFSVVRAADAGGVNGAGTVASATFKAKNQGPASFGLMGVNFSAQGGRQLETLPYNTVVEVK